MINRDTVSVFILWVVATIVVEVAWGFVDLFPVAASEEAHIVDDAFDFLTYIGIPVFTFVLVALVYMVLRFRASGAPDGSAPEDGPHVRTHHAWVWSWVVVTSALVITVIIHPGLTGLWEVAEAAEEDDLELVVEVTGYQWFWSFKYPEQGGLTSGELVLPVDTHVRFDITSESLGEDRPAVLHSFWVPAFRTKIDAVPGLTTEIHANITKKGDGAEDVNFRVQCAELCGLDHATMQAPVKVVEREEFNEWVLAQHN